MICYRDTTFCASEVTEHTCGREFTEQDAINAEKWWGGKDYPVAYSEFCKEADTNQPDHIVDAHEMVVDTNQASEDELDEILFEAIEAAATYTHNVTAEEADYIQGMTQNYIGENPDDEVFEDKQIRESLFEALFNAKRSNNEH